MAHVNTFASSHAHSPAPSSSSGRALLDEIYALSDSTILHQRAINNLSEALDILRNSPTTSANLQYAYGRSVTGVAAIKRLRALHFEAGDTALCRGAAEKENPRTESTNRGVCYPPVVTQKRRRRRYFESAYKRKVAQMVREHALPIDIVCRELNLNASLLRRWLQEFDVEQALGSAVPQPMLSAAESARTPQELLQQVQADNQLLKKLLAVFVREITHVAALQEKGE